MGLLFSAVGRIGYDKIVAISGIGYQGVAGFDGRLFAADAMKVEIRGVQPVPGPSTMSSP